MHARVVGDITFPFWTLDGVLCLFLLEFQAHWRGGKKEQLDGLSVCCDPA